MRITAKTEQPLQDGGASEYVYHDRKAWRCAVFVGKRYGSTKKCCPCTVNIACQDKQSSKTTSSGWRISWRWSSGKSSVRVVPTATTRILRRRFPGTCETVGQVFKFLWRLRWRINAIYTSLSPFVSFQSRFVTYLLTFPRNFTQGISVGLWHFSVPNCTCLATVTS